MGRGIIRDDVTDNAGNAIQGKEVTIYIADTVTKATLYDASTGGSEIGNPVVTDEDGVFEAYADTGEYEVEIDGQIEGRYNAVDGDELAELLAIKELGAITSADRVTYSGESANVEDALNARAPTVATLGELQAVDAAGFTGGEQRKVKGRTAAGDGYQGDFFWKVGDFSAEIAADTQSGIYVKANDVAATVGAWVRDFGQTDDGQSEIKSEWFNLVIDPATDAADAIQPAIDLAKFLATGRHSTTGGAAVVTIPSGVMGLTKLTRKSGVSLQGQGSRSTIFVALPFANPGVPHGQLELDSGPVVASHLKGMTFCGGASPFDDTPVNADQWGMLAQAKWDAGYTQGGLWHSIHEDVEWRLFNKGVWSRAGYTNANFGRPNQFLKFINCFVFVTDGGTPLRLTGQHGQIEFSGGDYSGYSGKKAQTNVIIDWDPDPSTIADNSAPGESTSDTAGVGGAVQSGENINFTFGASIQRANKAAFIRNAKNIGFVGCWFESLGQGFDFQSNGSAYIANNRFANVGDGTKLITPSAGNGWLINPGVQTNIDWGGGNTIVGTTDNIINPAASIGSGDHFDLTAAKYATAGKTDVTNVPLTSLAADGVLDVKGHRMYWLAPNSSDKTITLDTINSHLMPGDELVLYAYTQSFSITNSGNIRIPSSRTQFTVGNRTHITLRRIFGFSGYEWHIVHTEDEYSAVLPSSGEYYTQGTKIWRPNATAAQSPGWICTTTGLAGSTAVFKAMANLAA